MELGTPARRSVAVDSSASATHWRGNTMRVLVTGAAGFIGANLCRELAARPDVEKIIGLDDLSTGDPGNLSGTETDLVIGSVLDQKVVRDLVDEVDAVVHLAARASVPQSLLDPMANHEANATGALWVLEACRRRSVYTVVASSSSVYGAVSSPQKHEGLATRPLSPYAASKLAAEAYLLAYQAAFGLPGLALRFFNVYGPLQAAGHPYAAVIPTFVDASLRGEPLIVYGDGQQVRDFTFVGAVVRVLADAVLGRVTSAEPVNLAFGTRTTINDLARRVIAAVGVPADIRHAPPRAGDVRDSQAASNRLRGLFPNAAPTDLDEGLKQTVAWFRGIKAPTREPMTGSR
jgi:UDP-glucose 4-epimerase